jgi:hypothetical protein
MRRLLLVALSVEAVVAYSYLVRTSLNLLVAVLYANQLINYRSSTGLEYKLLNGLGVCQRATYDWDGVQQVQLFEQLFNCPW